MEMADTYCLESETRIPVSVVVGVDQGVGTSGCESRCEE
jgi:hypothetical protein